VKHDNSRSERRSATRWLVGLPFRLTGDLVVGAFKAGWWSAKVPVRVTARTTRLVGLKAVVLFAAGLAVGLLFAPTAGSDLRARLRRRLDGEDMTDTELADKVGYELAHAPRTWHLPQPEVGVLQGRVELTGQVPHERGREELERVAAAVPGVLAVENALTVAGDGGEGESE
jgi:osmotically-inducible protein OsmY